MISIEDEYLAHQLTKKAWQTYKSRGYRKSILLLDEALRLNPNNDMTWTVRGLAHIRLGKNQLAIQNFNQAIRLNPFDVDAHDARRIAHRLIAIEERGRKLLEFIAILAIIMLMTALAHQYGTFIL